ncbi:MAG: hypothetical protein ACP5GU_02010 [Thermoprotei archaeon]
MSMKLRSQRLALATIFGVIMAASGMLPTPIDKAVFMLQAFLLALGYLLIKRFGAMYVALIGGFLLTFFRPSFIPFSFLFAFLYGLLVDGLSSLLRVKTSDTNIKTNMLILSMTLSTTFIGLISYYTTVFVFGLLPSNPTLDIIIIIAGIINGALGGYLASLVWRRKLHILIT